MVGTLAGNLGCMRCNRLVRTCQASRREQRGDHMEVLGIAGNLAENCVRIEVGSMFDVQNDEEVRHVHLGCC